MRGQGLKLQSGRSHGLMVVTRSVELKRSTQKSKAPIGVEGARGREVNREREKVSSSF